MRILLELTREDQLLAKETARRFVGPGAPLADREIGFGGEIAVARWINAEWTGHIKGAPDVQPNFEVKVATSLTGKLVTLEKEGDLVWMMLLGYRLDRPFEVLGWLTNEEVRARGMRVRPGETFEWAHGKRTQNGRDRALWTISQDWLHPAEDWVPVLFGRDVAHEVSFLQQSDFKREYDRKHGAKSRATKTLMIDQPTLFADRRCLRHKYGPDGLCLGCGRVRNEHMNRKPIPCPDHGETYLDRVPGRYGGWTCRLWHAANNGPRFLTRWQEL